MPKCDFTLRHGFSPVKLLHIFRTPFTKNNPGWLLLSLIKALLQSYFLRILFRFNQVAILFSGFPGHLFLRPLFSSYFCCKFPCFSIFFPPFGHIFQGFFFSEFPFVTNKSYVCVSGGKKCLFFGNFGVCFAFLKHPF